MHGETPDLTLVQEQLNSISPSFCPAKWKQVTIHLLNGTTHSCYLPSPHKIPLDELSQNPSALHNTQHKKEVRRKMLAGERPVECGMCWAIEDLPGRQVSDRLLRSAEVWTRPYLNEIRQLPWDADVLPAHMEVSFSNLCNFKCSYCAPTVSSRWLEEIRQHGPYPLTIPHNDVTWLEDQGLMPLDEDENPYIQAFWKWWPEVYPHLQVFRVTGGEPLLSKHTFRLLDWIDERPHPRLELNINSNLGVPQRIFDLFLDKAEKLSSEGKVRRIKIYTSLDNVGVRAEYIRHGLDYPQFRSRVGQYLHRLPLGDISFMSTFNVLSVVGYEGFIDWILETRREFQTRDRWVNFDLPRLTGPSHLSAQILTPDYHERVADLVKYMEQQSGPVWSDPTIRPIEIKKMQRLLEWLRQPLENDDLRVRRRDFYLFFNEHDRRRGTDFLRTFPEMREFWELCKSLAVTA